jgi:hypothetical protein
MLGAKPPNLERLRVVVVMAVHASRRTTHLARSFHDAALSDSVTQHNVSGALIRIPFGPASLDLRNFLWVGASIRSGSGKSFLLVSVVPRTVSSLSFRGITTRNEISTFFRGETLISLFRTYAANALLTLAAYARRTATHPLSLSEWTF